MDNDTSYILKINNSYYAGSHQRYPDIYCIACNEFTAKKLNYQLAQEIYSFYTRLGNDVIIEKYNPRQSLKKALKQIIKLDKQRLQGEQIGLLIQLLAEASLHYLEEI